MHAHHKNLLRDFWLISPRKTPTGKTSQRGEILINFFSDVQDRKMVENTTYLHRQTSSQSLENLCSANQPTPFSFSVQNQMQMYSTTKLHISLENSANNQAVQQQKQAVLLPRNSCQNANRTLINQAVLSSKNVQQ